MNSCHWSQDQLEEFRIPSFIIVVNLRWLQKISSSPLFFKVLASSLFLLFEVYPVYAQQTISGIIQSSEFSPLEGVSVNINSSSIGTLSNKEGKFNIAARTGDTLTFSFVGFRLYKLVLHGETEVKILMSPVMYSLEEVIITGYSSQKIREITGSVASVSPKDLITIPAGQVEQMIQGRVAGLNVITSGLPGGASNVRLHGIGNFGDATPLYIIDGIQGDINSVNPYDIQSLLVLKDAGAYAIYGVRGANGVIVVTTKKGSPGKVKINYDFYIGKQWPLKSRQDVLNPTEIGNLIWLSKKNSFDTAANGNPSDPLYGNGSSPILPDYLYAGPHGDTLFEGSPYVNPVLYNIDPTLNSIYQISSFNKEGTDWFHEVFKPAISQDHTLSISGGGDKNSYLVSLGYLDQQGTLLNTYLLRYSARINTSMAVMKTVRIGENVQFTARQGSENPNQGYNFTADAINSVYGNQSYLPVYDINGNYASTGDGVSGFILYNPVAERVFAISKDNSYKTNEIFGNVYAEAGFLKYFTARSSFGGNLTNNYSKFFITTSYGLLPNGVPDNNYTETSGYRRSWTWTNTLYFSKDLSNHHLLKLLLGTEAISNYGSEVGGSRVGYYSSDPSFWSLSNGSPDGQKNFSSSNKSTLFSLFTLADYSFQNKYLFRGTLRRDGSSVFGPQNRYGLFPSASVAWRITNENFMKSLKWLTDLKIRASWGKTGFNGNTRPDNQFNSYGGDVTTSYYDLNGTGNQPVQGFRGLNIGNPETGWQEDETVNFGVDGILWKGKLSFSADIYKKTARGLLFPAALPIAVTGDATIPNINIGSVQNTGLDLLIGSRGSFSKNWSWDIAATFTTYTNKIIKLNGLEKYIPGYGIIFGSVAELGNVRNEIGHPMGSFYGYHIISLFQDSGEIAKSPVQDGASPGRFKIQDADGDGKISDADRVFIGNPNPLFTLGFNVGINYRQFDFSTFFYGSFGNELWNAVSAHGGNKAKLYDSWTPEKRNTNIPIAETVHNFSTDPGPNSFYVEDGSYLRNKSMVLGYSFPVKNISKARIDHLRIYAQVVNLFTITNYTGLDPELAGTSSAFGIDNGNYPNSQKQFLLGINMSF